MERYFFTVVVNYLFIFELRKDSPTLNLATKSQDISTWIPKFHIDVTWSVVRKSDATAV